VLLSAHLSSSVQVLTFSSVTVFLMAATSCGMKLNVALIQGEDKKGEWGAGGGGGCSVTGI